MFTYKTRGVCCTEINFEVENDVVKNVSFVGGCNGNLSGIASLVNNMKLQDVIDKLEGINCGYKSTSCPDQLAKALRGISK